MGLYYVLSHIILHAELCFTRFVHALAFIVLQHLWQISYALPKLVPFWRRSCLQEKELIFYAGICRHVGVHAMKEEIRVIRIKKPRIPDFS